MNLMHFSEFVRRFAAQGDGWVGYIPRDFGRYLCSTDTLSEIVDPWRLSAVGVARSDLYNLSSDGQVEDIELVISILSWGGMNRLHCIKALASWGLWRPIIRGLREGSLTRSQAYEFFFLLRRDKKLKGMGPAYYTKLIFFCSPYRNGYIMDQWTARSANLLGLSPQIALVSGSKGSHRVSDDNTSEGYEKFCNFVEDLSKIVPGNKTPVEVEEAMFSLGRGKGAWRLYVKANST